MKYVKNTVFTAFNQKRLMKNNNFLISKTCNKYVNLIIQLETDFCSYFVKDIFNFNKSIIWKLLSELKKAYIEKQKQAVQQLIKQSQSLNTQINVEMKNVFTIDSAAKSVC